MMNMALFFLLLLILNSPLVSILLTGLALFILAFSIHELSPDDLFFRCAQIPADEPAWNEFFKRYKAELYVGICRVIGFPPSQQFHEMFEDTLQKVHERLLLHNRRALRNFRGHSEGEARHYLRTIAINVAYNQVRSKRGRTISLDQDAESYERGNFKGIVGKGESDRILLKETVDRFLTENFRGRNKYRNILIFKLAVYEGLSAEQISSIVGIDITERAVENQLSRMRQSLREYLNSIERS